MRKTFVLKLYGSLSNEDKLLQCGAFYELALLIATLQGSIVQFQCVYVQFYCPCKCLIKNKNGLNKWMKLALTVQIKSLKSLKRWPAGTEREQVGLV